MSEKGTDLAGQIVARRRNRVGDLAILNQSSLVSRPLIRTQQKPLDNDTLDDMTR
jgi:hypothetical protein